MPARGDVLTRFLASSWLYRAGAHRRSRFDPTTEGVVIAATSAVGHTGCRCEYVEAGAAAGPSRRSALSERLLDVKTGLMNFHLVVPSFNHWTAGSWQHAADPLRNFLKRLESILDLVKLQLLQIGAVNLYRVGR